MLIYKDGQVAHYKEVFKNVSFPASGIPDSFLEQEGALKVSVYKPYDPATQVLVPCEPYVEDGFAYTVKVVNKADLPAPEPEIEIIEPIGNVTSNVSFA
jgi:hypothetical protein